MRNKDSEKGGCRKGRSIKARGGRQIRKKMAFFLHSYRQGKVSVCNSESKKWARES